MAYNYQTICHSNLLKGLPGRQKEVLVRRFGLGGDKETLESVGRGLHVTRERVRQIEADGLKKIRETKASLCQNVFGHFSDYFKKMGALKREDLALADLGGRKFKNHVFFLLTLGQPFGRYSENQDLHSFWFVNQKAIDEAQKAIEAFIYELNKQNRPLALPRGAKPSYIEISKKILPGSDGLYGLPKWPEINPRGVKDRAYLTMKKIKRPLHFTEITQLMGKGFLVQTVHNELIKDSRFVLVGRGLYALKEWGYEPGLVREVIAGVIQKAGKPLAKDQILKEVLKQREVKSNTILLNLQNKQYFLKNQEKYTIKEV